MSIWKELLGQNVKKNGFEDEKVLEETISNAEALGRLKDNPDFKKIINDLYITQESIRVVSLLSSPSQQHEIAQRQLKEQLVSISWFGGFLDFIELMGVEAKNFKDYKQNQDLTNDTKVYDNTTGELIPEEDE